MAKTKTRRHSVQNMGDPIASNILKINPIKIEGEQEDFLIRYLFRHVVDWRELILAGDGIRPFALDKNI